MAETGVVLQLRERKSFLYATYDTPFCFKILVLIYDVLQSFYLLQVLAR
jgi:hypothetical protein